MSRQLKAEERQGLEKMRDWLQASPKNRQQFLTNPHQVIHDNKLGHLLKGKNMKVDVTAVHETGGPWKDPDIFGFHVDVAPGHSDNAAEHFDSHGDSTHSDQPW